MTHARERVKRRAQALLPLRGRPRKHLGVRGGGRRGARVPARLLLLVWGRGSAAVARLRVPRPKDGGEVAEARTARGGGGR